MGGPGSGGRRVRSGFPPDPTAQRRMRKGDRAGWTHLPAGGRAGDPPAWPLSRPTKFERERWQIEWRKPQAMMWERLGLELQVALFIRTLAKAQVRGAAATILSAVLRQQDSLGLSVAGLNSLRWIIDEEDSASAVPRRSAQVSARDRLKVLEGGEDAAAS